MKRFREWADRFLVRLGPPLYYVVLVCIVGITFEVVEVTKQTGIQRGIDAHPMYVTATYSQFIEASWEYGDDTYVLTYFFGGQKISTRLRSLPRRLALGDQICVEIDETRPEHGRVCGTRGRLGDAEAGLAFGSCLLVFVLTMIGLSHWRWRSLALGGVDRTGEPPRLLRP